MSPYNPASEAITTIVPLNDGDAHSNEISRPSKKSTPRRRATPKPTKSRKRVLEVVENEASQRSSRPKRPKHYDNGVSVSQARSSVEEEEFPALQLDDIVDSAIIDDTDSVVYLDRPADRTAHDEAAPSTTLEAIDISKPNQSSRSRRTTSPFRFKRQGQENSIGRIDLLSLDSSKARRKLLISDLVEPRQEFDSIIEAEDFSMVPLSSVPSAQHHLSLRREAIHTMTAGTDASDRTPRQLRSGLRSQTASPIKAVQSKNAQSKQAEMLMSSEIAANSPRERFSPRRSPRRRPVSTNLQHREDSTAEGRALTQHSKIDNPTNTAPLFAGSIEEVVYKPLPSPSGMHKLPTDIHNADDEVEEGSELEEDSDPLNIVDEAVFDIGTTGGDAQEDEEPIYFMDDETLNIQPQADPLARGISLGIGGRQLDPQEQIEHIASNDLSSRKIDFKHNQVDEAQGKSNLEQSSMLRLPGGRETRSKVFSSPALPDIALRHTHPTTNPTPKKVKTPQLKRVVRAGKALQDVVEPAIRQRTQTTPEADLEQLSGDQSEGLFSGFSMATRRELRAGLRLGNELAKRQSSFMDTTMHTVSDQAETELPRNTDTDVLQRNSTASGRGDSNTKVVYPVLFGQENTQLPSPEISSNSADSKVEQSLKSGRQMHDISPATTSVAKGIPLGSVQADAHEIVENNPSQEVEELEFQDQGFASDSEPEVGNAENDLLDIWQLAADSTSFLQEPDLSRNTHTDVLDAGNDTMQLVANTTNANQSDARTILKNSILAETAQQPAARPFGIQAPTALSDLLTPSESDVSSPARTHGNRVEFTDFTGFTKDLLQAAASRDRKQGLSQGIHEEDEEERDEDEDEDERDQQRTEEHTTPADKIVQQYKKYPADVFTTRSFLETSPASAKAKPYSAKKPVSFRPNNRTASWLFDPSRLRKPPSPLKQVYPTAVSLLLDPINQALSEDDDELSEDNQRGNDVHPGTASPEPSSNDEQIRVLPKKNVRSVDKDVQPINRELAPVSRGIAIPLKATAQHSPSHRAITPSSDGSQSLQLPSPVAKADITVNSLHKPRYSTTAQNRNSAAPLFKSSSTTQFSEPFSQQSSFVSNASSNTSNETTESWTWIQRLSSVTTPILTSTKAVTNLAAAAFWNTQRETFYPERKPVSSTIAVLTKHNPFNDAHWSTLRTFYTAAQEQPDKYRLDLQNPCADYLGLEIESLGWKRELKEWELAVVARFLEFLEEEGVVEDDQEDNIDAEVVVKRVFSLWVGMITRGEAELTDGIAGAWDRRFVSRRDAVLAKQKEWLKSQRDSTV